MRFSMSHERLENFAQDLRRHSDTGVANAHENFATDFLDDQRQDPSLGHRFAGVLDEVAEHPGKAWQIEIEFALVGDRLDQLNILARQELKRLLV